MGHVYHFSPRPLLGGEELSSDVTNTDDHALLVESVQAIEQALLVLKQYLIDEASRVTSQT